jgi:GNAT superfamily N-acetyltransferase
VEDVTYRSALPADTPLVRELFTEYAAGLGIDLGFQGFSEELSGLPGKYAEPGGTVILAELRGAPCGCIALRPIGDGDCEMKRLFVRDIARGRGVGRGLVERILAAARARGYARMRLDTLSTMEPARALYRAFGFHDIPPYIYNPIPGALFMEKEL